MKVIRPGTLPTTNAPWWVGKTAQCGACGCQVELEAEDENHDTHLPPGDGQIQAVAERHPGGRQWAEGPCPTPGCKGKVTVTNTAGPLVRGGEFNPPLAKP